MAKEQGLWLNPTKISGACGRLMCCLAYEEKSYEYLNSITPQPGSVVRTPDGEVLCWSSQRGSRYPEGAQQCGKALPRKSINGAECTLPARGRHATSVEPGSRPYLGEETWLVKTNSMPKSLILCAGRQAPREIYQMP